MKSMRNIAILIGVTCVVQTLAQVCPYSDLRCDCDRDSITCYNLQQIPPLITAVNESQFPYLTIEGGNITTIPSNSLPAGLTQIDLLDHPITNISDDAFDASAATLETVFIRGAKLHNLPTALSKLQKLTDLDIEDTPIQVWDAGTLKQIAATLESLQLSNVSFSAWPSWIDEFHLLRTLDLSFNSLKSIPLLAFISIKHTLTHLYLTNTGLTGVPLALLIPPNLTTLDLSNNHLSGVSDMDRITRSPFAQTLVELSLDSVGLTRMANFSRLTSLETIRLSNNKISDVPIGSLPGSLKNLFLSNNSLSSVPKYVASMSGLSYLQLSNNRITEIEPNSLPSGLTGLQLSFNNLTIITNTTFGNLNLLRTLDLDSNPISTISPSAFSHLVSLQYLSIRNSLLTEMPLAFASLSPQVYIQLTTTQPLSCSCPARQELVQWFSSVAYTGLIKVVCSNGQLIDTYLRGQCVQTTASHETRGLY